MPDTELAIFDGNNHCIRNGMNPSAQKLARKDGTPTGMLFQSIMSFVSLYHTLEFKYAVFTFDHSGSDVRKDIRPEYKANRIGSASEQFKDQFRHFQRFLHIVGVPYLREFGVEADDLMAGLAWKARGVPTTIVTADHDLLQLVSPDVSVFRPAQGATPSVWYDTDRVVEKYSIGPEDLPKAWAICGDEGDGIKGVYRVGEKTAIKILSEFGGDLEAALSHPKCVGHEDLIQENYSLIKLDGELYSLRVPDDLLIPFDPGYPEALRDFFQEFELESLCDSSTVNGSGRIYLVALPLAGKSLSDKDAQRLYRTFPELRPDPDKYCPTCHKRGEYFWRGETVTCNCREQLQLHKHYLNAGIGILYQRKTWDDYEGDPVLRTTVENYLANSERFVDNGLSVILHGEYGVGKTFAMNMMLKDLLKQGFSVYATTFSGMIEMFTAGWYDPEEKKFFQERITKSQVLLLDDLGKEMKTKTNLAESTFDFMLRSRVQNGRPTFITTNMSEAGLRQGYGHAVMSLLAENAVLYNVPGKDYRLKARSKAMAEIKAGETRPIV